MRCAITVDVGKARTNHPRPMLATEDSRLRRKQRMRKQIFKTLLLAAAGLLTLPFLAQTAHADPYVDFSCAGSACTGSVANNSGTYSSSGIGGLQQTVSGAPDYLTGLFSLAFNTSTDAISMTGNAAAGNDTLLGTIVNASPVSLGSQ